MIFRLSCRQLRRNAFESIVIFVQLVITVLLITWIGTSLRDTMFAIESVSATHFDEFSYYQSQNGNPFDAVRDAQQRGASPEEVYKILTMAEQEDAEQKKLEESVQYLYRAMLDEKKLVLKNPYTGAFSNITVVKPGLADRTILPLSDGTWFNTQWDEAQGYQAIVSTDLADRFRLGETYTIPVESGFFTTSSSEITIRVVGVLSRENYMYPLNIPLGNEFLQRAYSGFLIRAEDPSAFASNSSLMADTGYVYGEYSADTESYFVTPMTERLKEFTDRKYSEAAFLTLVTVVIGMLALFGIGCSTVIKTSADIKRYAIMSFCGARWRDCVLIELGKVLLVYLFSMIVSSTLLWVVIPTLDMNYHEHPIFPGEFFIGVAVSFILYVPMALWKVWHTAKQNPIEVIKED